MKIRSSVPLIVSLALSIWGCGGGGGGSGGQGDPLATMPYTGLTTQATITNGNASLLATGAYLGGNAAASFGGIASVRSEGKVHSPTMRSMIRSLPRILENAVQRSGKMPADGRAAPLSTFDDTIPGTVSGSLHLTINVNDSTGDFSGTGRFDAYNDDGYATLNGDMTFSGKADPNTGDFERMTMDFRLLGMTTPDGTSTISGLISIQGNFPTETVAMSMRERNESTHKVYWVDNYAFSSTAGAGFVDVSISGRYYDPDFGYVMVSTNDIMRTSQGELWPGQGTMAVEGKAGGKAFLKFLSSVVFQVEADTNGDGNMEFDGGRQHWPGENSVPVANAGADQVVTVGAMAALDGSASADLDSDPLAWRWTLLSGPGASRATLSDPGAARPTFIPDFQGTYVFQLVINDGFADSVADTVTVTAEIFQPWTRVRMGTGPLAVAIGDVNGDGKNDVVATTWSPGNSAEDLKLIAFLQSGDGSLDPPVIYPTRGTFANAPATVAVGDVNGDGKNEVVVGDSGIGIEVYAQNLSGGLSGAVFYPTVNSNRIAIADLNGDGRMDIAGIGVNTNSVDVFYQDASGALGAPVTLSVNHAGTLNDLETGDLNHDGLTDLIVMNGWASGGSPIGIRLQRAGGGFDPPVYYDVAGADFMMNDVAVGDVNGDGNAELVLSRGGNLPGAFIGVMTQGVSGALNPAAIYATADSPGPIRLADVRGLGRTDILAAHPGWLSLGVYQQGFDGVLGAEQQVPLPDFNANSQGMAVGDINGDGQKDVVIAHEGLLILYHR